MAQPLGNYPLSFFYEDDLRCRRIAESLASFHGEAIKRSDTYHDMVHAVFQSGNIDVYIRDRLEYGSLRVIWSFDPRSGTYPTRIEISRRDIEAQACKASKEEYSKVTGMLANSFLIGGVRKAFRFSTPESPVETAERHEPEDDIAVTREHNLMLQGEPNDITFPYAGGAYVSKASSMDVIIRICEEIREHHILL
ncbi:hypothetical protein FPOAC2_13873 [Fusarium poae]|uniref:uncharacterized protein n=1 Tax=Fusarium poae TaxID=36050 RepID=UPI001D052AAF|nr:uncharacterized protein FPOAC1_013676 [Fusarium poae]KAG8664338.1 hypothetical protein FPOAC1_013676 [Fusarium poae]